MAASVARAEAFVQIEMGSWRHWGMQVLTWFCRGQALRQGTSRGALTAATAAPVAAFPSASSSTPAACRRGAATVLMQAQAAAEGQQPAGLLHLIMRQATDAVSGALLAAQRGHLESVRLFTPRCR